MPEAPPKPKRRRLWRRLLRWAFISGLCAFFALSGGLWWGYLERVSLANRALANIGPYQAQLDALDLDRNGNLEVKGLVLKERATGATVLRLPRLTGQVGIDHLRQKRLTELVLEGPEFQIDQRWLRPGAATPTSSEPIATGPPVLAGYSIGSFKVQGAKVTFNPNARTTAEVTISYSADDVTIGSNGRIHSGEQELNLSQLKINSESDGARPVRLEGLNLKGRVRDGILELDELVLRQPEVHASPTLITSLLGAAEEVRQQRKAAREAPVVPTPAAVDGTPAAAAPSLLVGIRVGKLEVEDASISLKRFEEGNPVGPVLPDADAHFTYRTSAVEWLLGQAPTMSSHTLEMNYVNVDARDNQGHVRFKSGQLKMDKLKPGQAARVEYLDLQEPHIRWTTELRKLLLWKGAESGEAGTDAPAKGDAPAPSPAAPAPQPEPAWAGISLERLTLSKADVWLKDPQLMSFYLETKGALKVDHLLLDGQGWHSPKPQTLEVTQGKLTFPPGRDGVAPQPWLELPRGELVITPDAWNANKHVEKLVLDKAVVRMREGNTPWMPSTVPPLVGPPYPVPDAKAVEEAKVAENKKAEPTPAEDSSAPVTPPWWQQLNFDEVTVSEVTVDLLGNLPKPLELKGLFSIRTERLEGGIVQERLKVENFNANLPTLSRLPFPVAQATSFEAAIRLPQMWQERKLEEFKLTGASVDASEALLNLFEKEETAEAELTPETPAPEKEKEKAPAAVPRKAATPERPWHVGKLAVEDSFVTISNLIPGLSSVKFGVEFNALDAPLTPEGLSSNVAPQRIELANLRIPSPYEPLRSVAELDSIFLSFTLGGLMRKEIDKVEIVSPTLYVGEDLFWYVDYYRKYVMEGAKPAMNAPMVVANDPTLDLEAAQAVQEAEPPTSQAAWSINALQVHGGKLIVAPKGIPLKGFRDPFPFSINTQVTRGTLEADLDIPEGTYEIPNLDLQLVGMKGHVKFNLPVKQKDNNLVETFEVDAIRWKGLKTGKAFLSVTYDSAGIYAQFGAEAYEGYVNGEVNVYLDDSFHWDGWIGGKKVQTHELTKVLCPGYFLLDGKVEATLVAQGSKDELYQADGSFKNHTPGRFTIKALNGLIDDLPKEWADLQKKLTQIGLETLRDFEYDQAEAKCRFYGREGNGSIRFSGPNGSRNFEINVYDHRWTTDKPSASLTTAGE